MRFVPRNAGTYSLNVMVSSGDNAEAVQGSPFPLVVRSPTNYGLLGGIAGAEEPEGKARIGEAGQVHIYDNQGMVHHPCGIDFDHTGRFLFVADQSNHRIQCFDTQQGHEAVCMFGKRGFGGQDFDTPHAVCTDRDNRVVVSDVLNHRLQVLEFNPRTKRMRHMRSVGGPGSGPGQFQFPKGLCVTENGHLMVCDFGNHRVQVFDTADQFKFLREWGTKGSDEGQFNSPLDVTPNCEGEILVSDMNNRIQIFDTNAKFLRMFGKFGRKESEFNYPVSLVTNDENALFVCDQGNHRMQVFHASDGSFIHKWGGTKNKKKVEEEPPAEEEGNVEKPPEWVGIRNPAGVAVNADGTVVVSDYKLNAIFAF
jgi:sugar lactone lactonase YvrE